MKAWFKLKDLICWMLLNILYGAFEMVFIIGRSRFIRLSFWLRWISWYSYFFSNNIQRNCIDDQKGKKRNQIFSRSLLGGLSGESWSISKLFPHGSRLNIHLESKNNILENKSCFFAKRNHIVVKRDGQEFYLLWSTGLLQSWFCITLRKWSHDTTIV